MKIYKIALTGDEEAEMLYQQYREKHDRHMGNFIETELNLILNRGFKMLLNPKFYMDLTSNDQGDIIHANLNVYASQAQRPHHFNKRINMAKNIMTSRQIHDEIKQAHGIDSTISLHIEYGNASIDGIAGVYGEKLDDEVFSV